MKYLSLLLVFTVMFCAGTANAQTPSALNGKSFTYVVKKIDGTGPEIIDRITFNGGTVSSETFGATGFKAGTVTERAATSNSTRFEVVLTSSTEGTMSYKGAITDNKLIDGTVIVTDKTGAQTTMAMRGMLTEDWDNIQKAKKEYQQNKK